MHLARIDEIVEVVLETALRRRGIPCLCNSLYALVQIDELRLCVRLLLTRRHRMREKILRGPEEIRPADGATAK